MKRRAFLGISAYYHDSAAALTRDGVILAAAQEERFSRVKHDASFPRSAVRSILEGAGILASDLSAVVFYEKPLLKLERMLEMYQATAPRGAASFQRTIPQWMGQKFFLRSLIARELPGMAGPILFSEHHLSHAASAFYPSPFEEAAILVCDGVGEWATISIGLGQGNRITMLREQHFPHSLGLLYSACTAYCGFEVNEGEYKLMGLAALGTKGGAEASRFKEAIMRELVSIKEDGSVALNMEYFPYMTSFCMYDRRKWEALFGIPPRSPSDSPLPYAEFALAVQEVAEEILLRLARTAREITGKENLVMAGGVALNCAANGAILRSGLFKDVWIQPAAGDAGGALGAALLGEYIWSGAPRVPDSDDSMRGSLLGCSVPCAEVDALAADKRCVRFADFHALTERVARLIAEGNIVGWVQDKMEWGPRALGNRSIFADPRQASSKDRMNRVIKGREDFRPFAPAVLEEDAPMYFDGIRTSPYMLFTFMAKSSRAAEIPAVVHADGTSRVQTVAPAHAKLHALLSSFKDLTGQGMLLNTSFNRSGEPIVATAKDAHACFMATDMDCLVIGDMLFSKHPAHLL